MSAAFPLSSAPVYYTQITPGAARGVFYVGGAAPFVTLSKPGATAYAVNDYWGNVVSSGPVSGLTLTPVAPSGGWKPGWYRLYLTGASVDSLFGPAYGSTNFVVARNDSRFSAITDASTGFSGSGSDFLDLPMKGALGIGTSRVSINNASSVSSDVSAAQAQATLSTKYWTVPSDSAYYDAARTRLMWVNFPNGGVNKVVLGALGIYCKDGTIDGSTVTVTASAGSVSGTKVTVNSEVYDNLSSCNAAATALAASAFVVGFASTGNGGGNGPNAVPLQAATAIGNSYFNGVKSAVSTLYAAGITRFEGPSNEPNLNAETVQQMRLFQAAVHAGNASAKAIGPCAVSLGAIGSSWDTFFAAGGATYCDEISFHAYNSQTNGDINLGRAQIGAFLALLAKYGLQSKPLWQTESTQVMSSVYGVYHPRRSRVPLLQTLLWEQFGLPRERNAIWYDVSHGFWGFPAWIEMGDGTLNPLCMLYRTLAEETFGQTHSSLLSFGTFGDRLFLGSLYSGATCSTIVIVMTSYMPNAIVTLSVSGANSLIVIDGMGNSTTITVSGGLAVIHVADIPSYVRLPTGVTATVYSCNDWPPISSDAVWANGAYGYAPAATGTISPASSAIDNQWIYTYVSSPNGVARGATMPDIATITWPTATRVDRLLIWSGLAWQSDSTLATFTVETSIDGISWASQQTIDVAAGMTSFQFGADANGTGCQRETYWPEQYVFDIKLPGAVTCKAIRLNVIAASCGGEPDAAAVQSGGQGADQQYVTLQEIVVLCDDNVRPHYVTTS